MKLLLQKVNMKNIKLNNINFLLEFEELEKKKKDIENQISQLNLLKKQAMDTHDMIKGFIKYLKLN